MQSPTTQNTMRLPSEDISSRLPNWITGSDWYQKEHARALERDQMNQGIPKEDRKFMLFEWIKSIINNPNVSSTQASQILNDAGVMAKDLMMAMNPMGTAYAGQGKAQEMTSIPSYDPTPTPIVNPEYSGPTTADPGGPIATGPHSDRARPTAIDPGFTQPVREPTTAMYGSNVRASQMTPRLEQERIFGEFFDMPSIPPAPQMGFEDRKRDSQRRASVPAPMPQSTGLLPPVGRTPYQGPGKRGFSQGRSTRQPRRFGPH